MNLIELDDKALQDLSKDQIRAFIQNITEKALSGAGDTVPIEVPIHHHFSKDVYAREMRVPKGAVIVGKIHKFQNLNILSQGEVSVISIDGVMRVKAPYTFVASPGAQRVFYMHEDTVWTVVHGTDETDVEKIEEKFIAKSYEELGEEVKCLGS